MTTISLLDIDRCHRKKTQAAGFIVAAVLSFFLGAFFFVSYESRLRGSCPESIDQKINPNSASVASLIRLPGIGPSRAAAIVEYRSAITGSKKAFESSSDLEKIKGIGPKTAGSIDRWLRF
jgi:endonuclease III